MNNVINYYYNLNPINVYRDKNKYKFVYKNNKYLLIKIVVSKEKINDSYKISNDLINHGIYCHSFVYNNNNQLITLVNNEPYVLLKESDNDDYNIILNDIMIFNTSACAIKIKSKIPWKKLWEYKIDYLEYQISQIGRKYPLLRQSFDYFIGVSEMAISMLNYVDVNNVDLYVQHSRITANYMSDDFYNPLNFVLDSKVRDPAEYFKSNILNNSNIIEDIKYYINYSDLTENEMKLFFIRMLFPTYYFDLYEEIVSTKVSEKQLNTIILNINTYEQVLVETYYFIKQYTELPEINWYKKI